MLVRAVVFYFYFFIKLPSTDCWEAEADSTHNAYCTVPVPGPHTLATRYYATN